MVTKDITNTGDKNENSSGGGGTNTGLIAGLTTGLVIAAVVALTAGLLIYRKRKRAQMGVERKSPISVETPPSSSNMILTAPTISPLPSNITVPMASHLGEEARYIGSPLFIPPLLTTTLDQTNETMTTTAAPATSIQRSLTLSSKPHLLPPSATNTMINRSSSVKVTKYDYNPPPQLDDDDLDHVQIRRAISVKRRNAAATHRGPPSRSTSLRSQARRSRLLDEGSSTLPPPSTLSTTDIEHNSNNEDDDDDDDDEDDTTTGAIQVICAKPTIARIRSVSRANSSGRRKPTVDNPRTSMRSMPDSTHSSSVAADGEITVYWQPPSN